MDKAYIVANEEQEREVLEKLEREGYVWRGLNIKPTKQPRIIDEPIPIFARDDKRLTFDYKVNEAYLADYEIVFDGRKEEQMSEKYVVSQEFMNDLNEWKEAYITDTLDEKYHYVSAGDLDTLPGMIKDWWIELNKPTETNNRLIAIIRWVNGEDVFEVEKPKKWVVRSKDSNDIGEHRYLRVTYTFSIIHAEAVGDVYATKFDTKEEAQEWANSHQEVIEVKE